MARPRDWSWHTAAVACTHEPHLVQSLAPSTSEHNPSILTLSCFACEAPLLLSCEAPLPMRLIAFERMLIQELRV